MHAKPVPALSPAEEAAALAWIAAMRRPRIAPDALPRWFAVTTEGQALRLALAGYLAAAAASVTPPPA